MNKYKLILVDDEPMILKALKREVEEFASINNLEVLTYESPIKALKDLGDIHESVAIIISDQRMPELKGCEFLGNVRLINPEIITILLTAHTDIEDIIKTIKTGLYSFILKPWDITYLLLELEKGLELFKLKLDNKIKTKKLEEELKWGGELQRKLLDTNIPNNTNAKIFVAYEPIEEFKCGGDYYDFIYINKDLFIVLVGDVSGHGIKAAFITFIIKTLTRHIKDIFSPSDLENPAKILAWLNNSLCEELSSFSSILVTFNATLVDIKNMRITLSNAGHVPIKILHNNSVEDFNVDGTALGFQRDLEYKNLRKDIDKNSKLIFSTDGITEFDFEGKTFDEVLVSHSDSYFITESVLQDIKKVSKGRVMEDDMTIIAVDI